MIPPSCRTREQHPVGADSKFRTPSLSFAAVSLKIKCPALRGEIYFSASEHHHRSSDDGVMTIAIVTFKL